MDLTSPGWTPARVVSNGSPLVEWCWTGDERFIDPFFEQTLDRCVRRPFSLLFRPSTPISAVAELPPGLAPSGIVFHTSRCGSTLVTQMFAASPRNLVLSEPRTVDTILRYPAPVEDRVRWLRRLVGALARPRAEEQRCVLKLDAWAILSRPIVRAAFPDTPWIFLYRDPVEIVVSQLGHRGAHMVPGVLPTQLFGLEPAEVLQMPEEEYCARVLAAICGAALAAKEERALLVEYRQLPGVVTGPIARLFGIEPTSEMEAVAGLDAKNPALPFEDDSARKRASASPAVREAVDRWARDSYNRLEDARERQRKAAAC